MKLICLIGNDPLQVLMPLQLTRLFDGAYLIVNEETDGLAQRILTFLEREDDEEDPPWKEAVQIIHIGKEAEYYSARETISDIIAKEYCRNEEVAFNYSGKNSPVKFAMIHTANHFLAPNIVVNSASHRIELFSKSWDRKTISREFLPWHPLKATVSEMLGLSGLCWERIFSRGFKGINFERKIFSDFSAAKINGLFDDVEHNLLFTWNQEGQKNEIDIVALRRGVLCFISLKSGKNVQKAAGFKREYKKMLTRYPEKIAGMPCLHVLISKATLYKKRFYKMLANGILAVDDVRTDEQAALALEMISYAADLISKTGRSLPYDFYHRFINRQFSKWGTENAKMKRKTKVSG